MLSVTPNALDRKAVEKVLRPPTGIPHHGHGTILLHRYGMSIDRSGPFVTGWLSTLLVRWLKRGAPLVCGLASLRRGLAWVYKSKRLPRSGGTQVRRGRPLLDGRGAGVAGFVFFFRRRGALRRGCGVARR